LTSCRKGNTRVDIFSVVSWVGDSALDFLSWYNSSETLWKLFLIPVCVVAYAIMIVCDAINEIADYIEDL
jgi:hypothetical protein